MLQDKEQAIRKKIPTAQRERLLWEASREYMRGNISAHELRVIEHSTGPYSRSASSSHAEKQTGENQANS
jgi:hypothetical protein